MYGQRSYFYQSSPRPSGIKTVKTSYSSRINQDINEPMALQYRTYQTGSSSQAYEK